MMNPSRGAVRRGWAGVAFTAVVVGVSGSEIVDVHLNVEHRVGGVSEFRRDRFILLHAGLTDNDWDSDAQRAQFLTDYDVYLGRNNGSLPWQLSQTAQDPAKPGWPSPSSLQSRGASARSSYASQTAAHPLEFRALNQMVGGQMSMYPNGQTNGNGWAVTNYDALGFYFEQYLTHFHGTGGATGPTKPAMVEVVNEPFVTASKYGTTRSNITVMHNVVASRIKASHPGVMVGGYTAAHPAYEDNNFSHWNNNWKLFIDLAGTNMDFFSLHLYDYLNKDVTSDPALTQYRSGSNVEAILDMIEHYSMLTLGAIKPFTISEYGAFEPKTGGELWSAENDWSDIRSYSSILMQLLERPDRMWQAMPFTILKAEWGRDSVTGNPYGPRLLRQNFEAPGQTGNHWVYTERIKWFELWADVRGTRVDTRASNPDLQVDAYVNGANAYVILNNLEHSPQVIDLDVFGVNGAAVAGITSKHLYASNGLPTLETNSHPAALARVTLETEATMILHYSFTSPVVISETSTEVKYFANTYLQPITANVPVVFNITNIQATAAHGEAVLRLGLGRDHGRSLSPSLLVNGVTVPVPADWRGYDQSTRSRFFGVLEIPVPYSLIESNTTVSVTFGDGGGHVSSVALQMFEFSTDLRGQTAGIPIDYHRVEGSNIVLGFTNGPSDGSFAVLSKTNLLDPAWMTNQSGLPVSSSGAGEATNPMVAAQQFFRLMESPPPRVPVTGVDIWPASDTVGVGGLCNLVATVLPENATDRSLSWVAINPGVATVTNGIVTGVATGNTLIRATTTDGGFIDTSNITVGTSSPGIAFDSANNYKSPNTFPSGGQLVVKCTFDAGPGHTVTAGQTGIKYWLREIENNTTWKVLKDYLAYDSSVIGVQSGGSTGTIPLTGVPPTSSLPAGGFYFLFITMDSSNGSSYNAATSPVIITGP